jgi:hypothetical protein
VLFEIDAPLVDDAARLVGAVVECASAPERQVRRRAADGKQRERRDAPHRPPRARDRADQQRRCEDGRGEKASRHEISADRHHVDHVEDKPGGERRYRRPAIQRRQGDGESDRRQRDRIAIDRIEEIEQPLHPHVGSRDAHRELRIGRIRKRKPVVHDREHRPGDGGNQPDGDCPDKS